MAARALKASLILAPESTSTDGRITGQFKIGSSTGSATGSTTESTIESQIYSPVLSKEKDDFLSGYQQRRKSESKGNGGDTNRQGIQS